MKKGLKVKEGKNKACSSRKNLPFGSGQSVDASTAENIIQDDTLSRINVDELVESNNYTQVKVVIVNPNKHISTHSNFDEDTKRLLINLVRKNWVTVSNIIFRHAQLKNLNFLVL